MQFPRKRRARIRSLRPKPRSTFTLSSREEDRRRRTTLRPRPRRFPPSEDPSRRTTPWSHALRKRALRLLRCLTPTRSCRTTLPRLSLDRSLRPSCRSSSLLKRSRLRHSTTANLVPTRVLLPKISPTATFRMADLEEPRAVADPDPARSSEVRACNRARPLSSSTAPHSRNRRRRRG